MKKISKPQNVSERGFSVVEMIVAMVVFMIVIGTIYGLLQVGLIDRNRASRRSDVLKNARAAMHLIGRDALNAGLSYNKNGAVVPDGFITARLGIPTYPNNERDILTSVVGGNNLSIDILNPDSTARTDIISFSYRDTDFNTGNTITLNSASAPGGAPATARLQTNPNDARNAKVYDLYLVESASSQVAVMATATTSNSIDIATGDPLALNQPFNGSGISSSLLKACTVTITDNCTTYNGTTNVAAVKKFFWVAYKVKSDGTLVRQTFGNNTSGGSVAQIQELPVAYNIEDFQIRYVLEDGTATDNPAAGPDLLAGTADDIPSNFNLVRQITVTIKVQATENDEQTKKPESITLSGTFSTRNLEYDAG
jgi:type II secretory pathway pseudopilin PulG